MLAVLLSTACSSRLTEGSAGAVPAAGRSSLETRAEDADAPALPAELVVDADPGPLQTVGSLDLERYVGSWYEYARYPNRFEKDLVGVCTRYDLEEDGGIRITNTGWKKSFDGERTEQSARAWLPDESDPTRWRVRFSGLVAAMFPVDYWVVARGERYEWAIVGQPKRNNLWILTRSASVDPQTHEEIVRAVVRSGHDPARLEFVAHPSDAPAFEVPGN
jgi:apolipoprotein D and lipocalin family protein